MPPKKKCTQKARKAELVFLERPREGPVHCYETPLPSAENPRCVPTKPVDQNTSAAWVCPQFETTKSVVLKACQKKHRGPHKPQNQDANHSLPHAGGASQRAIACKFPPLTFENPEGYAVHPSDHPNCLRKNTQRSHSQPKKRTAAKANIQANSQENCEETPLLPAPQPVEPEVFSSPDVETPQVPFIRNWRCSSTLPQRRSHAWHPEKELAFGIDPCGTGESAAVLVTDTPEHEYGVKVTWRQRPHLMKYLRERGKLSAADVLVKANPELSRTQANI
ncbi:RAD9, HUS1, RAD1-interacting nuclear orphan protein 1 [Gymnogyps californianus]|uniref:RAD9, HUS1, RAD1-interacting nuclear orphan protein 1 n=1 Tax=Gymnogyps californianus TaxID=33616 RepID=UPI0021CA87A8|nr:RAD9, HUS1, RAD1-interacting nuclear orphan protein 1 [Gymnogyps californianus]XP_050768211.1 RAD9, HUS1, RAD1-interacting nuclear orphan protein 1 [Gymnogyps californianus]